MVERLAGDSHMTFTTENPGSCSTVARQAAPKACPEVPHGSSVPITGSPFGCGEQSSNRPAVVPSAASRAASSSAGPAGRQRRTRWGSYGAHAAVRGRRSG